MINSQLVFRNEYRLDLKPVDEILIPYLFINEANLIISVQANPTRSYKSSGRIEQVLIDLDSIGSTEILRFGSQVLQFSENLGRFQLKFYPNRYLGRTTIYIKRNTMPLNNPSIVNVNFPTSSNVAPTTVASSATSTTIAAANANRKGGTVWNNSTAKLYLELGATASLAAFTAILEPGGYYEIPFNYTGVISGIWTAVNGNAQVRELT